MRDGTWIGTAAFAIFLIVHWLMFRRVSVHHPSKVLLRLFIALVIAAALVSCWLPLSEPHSHPWRRRMVRAVEGWFVMGALFALYLPVYYAVRGSLWVGMLVRLRRSTSGMLPLAQLRSEEAAVETARARLESMAKSGYLVRDATGYALSTKGRWVARVFSLIRRCWRI